MADKLPDGFDCECGKRHAFGGYVAAHWRDELIHTCDGCGARHSVIIGHVKLIDDKPERKRKRTR